jgi:hypothetical protein
VEINTVATELANGLSKKTSIISGHCAVWHAFRNPISPQEWRQQMSEIQNHPQLTVGKVLALQMEDLQQRFQKLEDAALILTTPMTPGGEGFLPTVLLALAQITTALEKQQKAISSIHETLLEPGIVRAMQRAIREP